MKGYSNRTLSGVLIIQMADVTILEPSRILVNIVAFAYGYMNGPLGFTWGINWAKW